MGIKSWIEDFEADRAQTSIGNGELVVTAAKRFVIISDNESDSSMTIGAEFGAEEGVIVGAGHPDNSLCTIRDVNCSRKDSFQYHIDVSYSTASQSTRDQRALENPDPLEWDVIIEGDTYTKNRLLIEDKDGKAALNKAGDYPDPPLEEEWEERIFQCEKNYEELPDWYFTHQNSLNEDEIQIGGFTFPPKHVAIRNLKYKPSRSKLGNTYLVLTWEYYTDATDELIPQFLNEGLRAKFGLFGDTKVRSIVEEDIDPDAEDAVKSQKISAPVMLDDDGRVIFNPTVDSAKYVKVEAKYLMPYSSLPGVGSNV